MKKDGRPHPADIVSADVYSVATEFRHLIQNRIAEPARWAEIWSSVPEDIARSALLIAAICIPGVVMRDFLESLCRPTSPARLFVALGDGVNFDERERMVAFRGPASVHAFHRAYPDWTVLCG